MPVFLWLWGRVGDDQVRFDGDRGACPPSSEPDSWSAPGSVVGMHPRYRRLVIPGALLLLLVIVLVAAIA